jgi:hypothetical protein
MIRWYATDKSYCQHRYFGLTERDRLERVAMNKNDTFWFTNWTKTPISSLIKRDIMVIDEYNRVIDPRIYKNEIKNYRFKTSHYYRNNHPYVYRFDPVPRLSSKRRHHYKSVHTFQERKMTCDDMAKGYIRGNRTMRSLPCSWSGRGRSIEENWKSKKVRKQWMKNA